MDFLSNVASKHVDTIVKSEQRNSLVETNSQVKAAKEKMLAQEEKVK